MAETSETQEPENEYESGSDLEDWSDYKVGGYYPVCLKQLFPNKKDGRFEVLQKLGWGHFSTVWLVQERSTKKFYALKVQKGKQSYREAARDEVKLINEITSNPNRAVISQLFYESFPMMPPVPKDEVFCIDLVDWFEEASEYGTHVCMAFPIMGPNLLDLIRHFEDNFECGMPVPLVKNITRQILLGLVYLHEYCGIIHTDLKPENVMIEFPEEDLAHVVEKMLQIKKKPLSQKFYDSIHKSSKNAAKNKKKLAKKKAKKAQALVDQPQAEENEGTSDLRAKEDSKEENHQKNEKKGEESKTIEKQEETSKRTENDAKMQNEGSSSKEEATRNTNEEQNTKNKTEGSTGCVKEEGSTTESTANLSIVSSRATGFDQYFSNENVDVSKENFADQPNSNERTNENSTKEQPELPFKTIEMNPTLPETIDSPSQNPKEAHSEQEKQEKNQNTPKEKKKNSSSGAHSEDEEAKDDGSSVSSEEPKNKQKILATVDWKNTFKWKKEVSIPLDDHLKVKIVDFGNACWIKEHFTDRIQTREYRSPEAILRAPYDQTTDLWSVACLVFEMLTSNFLFKPKKKEGKYKKNDDHLALLLETLGKIPKNWAKTGKRYSNFFNREGNLKNIRDVEVGSMPVSRILIDEGSFEIKDALKIENFLVKMLEWDPKDRVSARELLKDEWLCEDN